MRYILVFVAVLVGTLFAAENSSVSSGAFYGGSRSDAMIEFRDKALFECVKGAAKKTYGQVIIRKNLLAITTLSCKGIIKDLSGIEKLINLEELDLHGKEIEDITPLGKLKKLRVLNLYNNKIKDLTPILNLNELEYLDLSYNNIKKAEVAFFMDLPKLSYLDLSYNSIEKADELKKLKHISYVVTNNNTPSPEKDVAIKDQKELHVK